MSENVVIVDDEPEPETHVFKNHRGPSAAFMAMMAMGGFPRVHIPDPPPLKRCVNCGEVFRHNNAFCSAECCRAYKAKGRKP